MKSIFENKRGQQSLTKTGILFTILVFYTFIIYFVGVAGAYFDDNTVQLSQGATTGGTNAILNYPNCNCGVITCNEYRSLHGQLELNQVCSAQGIQGVPVATTENTNIFSIGAVVYGLSGLPIVFNILLFSPLVIIIGWIFISSLPTINGGG